MYKFSELRCSNPGDYEGSVCNFYRDSAIICRHRLPSFSTLAFRDELQCRNSDFSRLIGNISLHRVEFDDIWSSDPGVYDFRSCTTGVDHFSEVSLATFAKGRHC